MPGYLLTSASTVTCQHSGTASPTAPLTRVMVDGSPAIGAAAPYTVAGCTFVPPAAGPPCVSAQWTVTATRLVSDGVALVLEDSTAVCVASGTDLQVASVQSAVKGT
jgi:hypothetical protein